MKPLSLEPDHRRLPNADCLSDLTLDLVVANVSPRASIEKHLAGCERCRQRLELFEQARVSAEPTVERLLQRASAQSRNPQPSARDVESSSSSSPWSWLWPGSQPKWRLVISVASMAALVLLVFAVVKRVNPIGVTDEVGFEGTRPKGTSVKFFRQRGSEVTEGVSGDLFQAGDALRFQVSGGGNAIQLFLVGIESSGKISTYYPFGGEHSVALESGEVTLPGSLVLDDSPDTEFLLAVFSPTPISLKQISDAVREASERGPLSLENLRSLPLPGQHHWIVIRKR
jgi:hypothetical protein